MDLAGGLVGLLGADVGGEHDGGAVDLRALGVGDDAHLHMVEQPAG